MKKIIIINGPNLNLLGKRQPEIYGNTSFEEYFTQLVAFNKTIELHYFQSNIEGILIDKIQEVGFSYDGIIINMGGYSHTSIAIADAIASITTPTLGVHISNIYEREQYRHIDLMDQYCIKTFVGMGLNGYQLAIDWLLHSW